MLLHRTGSRGRLKATLMRGIHGSFLLFRLSSSSKLAGFVLNNGSVLVDSAALRFLSIYLTYRVLQVKKGEGAVIEKGLKILLHYNNTTRTKNMDMANKINCQNAEAFWPK